MKWLKNNWKELVKWLIVGLCGVVGSEVVDANQQAAPQAMMSQIELSGDYELMDELIDFSEEGIRKLKKKNQVIELQRPITDEPTDSDSSKVVVEQQFSFLFNYEYPIEIKEDGKPSYKIMGRSADWVVATSNEGLTLDFILKVRSDYEEQYSFEERKLRFGRVALVK